MSEYTRIFNRIITKIGEFMIRDNFDPNMIIIPEQLRFEYMAELNTVTYYTTDERVRNMMKSDGTRMFQYLITLPVNEIMIGRVL